MKIKNRILDNRTLSKKYAFGGILFLTFFFILFYFFKPEKRRVEVYQIKEKIDNAFKENEYWPDHIKVSDKKIHIHYTFLPTLTEKIKKLLKKYNSDYSSVVVIDNNTGAILSAIGYVRKEKSFSRVLPFSSSHPSASLFKIVTMAGLLENGRMTLESPLTFTGGSTTLYKYQIFKPPHKKWRRTQTLKKAFATSNNVIFGKAAVGRLTKDSINTMALKFGFNQSLMKEVSLGQSFFEAPIDDYNMAELASGFNKKTMISPVHAAIFSSIVANKGIIKFPYIVSGLSDKNTKENTWKMDRSQKRVIKERTSEHLFDVMEYTVSNGTARKSFKKFDKSLKKLLKIGGKTGSITGGIPYGKRDWFSAFAIPLNSSHGKGIAISVMNINVKKWFVRSTFLAKNIIELYYNEIDPIKKSL